MLKTLLQCFLIVNDDNKRRLILSNLIGEWNARKYQIGLKKYDTKFINYKDKKKIEEEAEKIIKVDTGAVFYDVSEFYVLEKDNIWYAIEICDGMEDLQANILQFEREPDERKLREALNIIREQREFIYFFNNTQEADLRHLADIIQNGLIYDEEE